MGAELISVKFEEYNYGLLFNQKKMIQTQREREVKVKWSTRSSAVNQEDRYQELYGDAVKYNLSV